MKMSIIKRITAALLAVIMLTALCACDKDGVGGTTGNYSPIRTAFDTQSNSKSAENGDIMITADKMIPSFSGGGKGAAERLAKEYDKLVEQNSWNYDEMLKSVEDFYNSVEDAAYFAPYSAYHELDVMRSDMAAYSLLICDSSYTGGAHGSYWSYALNADPKTGKRLTLGDISKNEAELKNFCADYVEQFIVNAEFADSEYSDETSQMIKDYAMDISKTIEDYIITEDTWYFSEDGIIFICNPETVGPYALGMILVTVPYSELSGLLKENMLNVQPAVTGSDAPETEILIISGILHVEEEGIISLETAPGEREAFYTDDMTGMAAMEGAMVEVTYEYPSMQIISAEMSVNGEGEEQNNGLHGAPDDGMSARNFNEMHCFGDGQEA